MDDDRKLTFVQAYIREKKMMHLPLIFCAWVSRKVIFCIFKFILETFVVFIIPRSFCTQAIYR